MRSWDSTLSRVIFGFAAVFSIASCDQGTESNPAPPNQLPGFTSAASSTIVENASLNYQAAATDSDGDPLAYTVSGGPDAARFSITNAGLLSFTTPPDFERPGDAGVDNIYDVQLLVSDGRGGTGALTLRITVTDTVDEAITRQIGSGFVNAVAASYQPEFDRLYIAEPGSIIQLATDGSGTKQTIIGTPGAAALADGSVIIALAVGGVKRIPLGDAFSEPQPIAAVMRRRTDGQIAVDYYVQATGTGVWAFRRVVASAIPPAGALTQDLSGSVRIENDRLYFAFSDAGSENLAQDISSKWGKVFCGIPANYYSAPIDQPISIYDCSGAQRNGPERLGLGLRRPNGVWADRGEISQELNLRPDLAGNFGWPYRDGTSVRSGGEPASLISPVLQYKTGDGENEGRGIVPGFIYTGTVPAFRNQYFFGDVTGKVWSVPASSLVRGQTLDVSALVRRDGQLNPAIGSVDRIAAFAQDNAGNIYIVDGLDGQVFRIDAR